VLADLVRAEGEGGDDAEVAPAAAQRPEQVRVPVLVGRDQGAVGQHHVGGQQVVHGQAEAPGQVADAAAQGQPADAGGGDEAAGDGHPEGHGGVVDIRPQRPAVDPHGVRRRVHRRGAHRAQVDDQRVVGDGQPGGLVAAAAHREPEGVFTGEVHGRDDVRGVGDPGDGGRAAVDHAVVDGACLVVGGVLRQGQGSAQGGAQRGKELRGGFGGLARGFHGSLLKV
jgi:hypothetical protein